MYVMLTLFATVMAAPMAAPALPLLNSTAPLKEIPKLGFGTWNLDPGNSTEAVALAIKTGYRHIDCASAYKNQIEVGRGIKSGLEQVEGLQREDLWITSKLWNDGHCPEDVAQVAEATLKDLGLDYLDNYLMHWPVAFKKEGAVEEYMDTWHAMERLVDRGLVKHIGISNFNPEQLQLLLSEARIKPYNHQMEIHPFLPQKDWLQWNLDRGIRVTAYSPLGNANPEYHSEHDVPRLLELKAIQELAKSRAVTPAQVVLAWGMAHATSVIPKSSHASRIVENFNSIEFSLTRDEQKQIDHISDVYLARFADPSDEWGVHLFAGLQK